MAHHCNVGCGACCIAPAISSPIPGMPRGKPAGQRCVQLSDDNRCRLFGMPERPDVCSSFQADSVCVGSPTVALEYLNQLELVTAGPVIHSASY